MLKLDAYILKPIIKIWFKNISQELLSSSTYFSIQIHSDHKSIINSISLYNINTVNTLPIFFIDIENEHYYEFITQAKELQPSLQFIAIGQFITTDRTALLLSQGFKSVLEVGDTVGDIYNAIHFVSKNKIYLSSEKINQLLLEKFINIKHEDNRGLNTIDHDKTSEYYNQLTIKQSEIIQYLIKGYTYKEIASFIGVSTYTINQRAKAVYKKLKVNSRNELAFKMLK